MKFKIPNKETIFFGITLACIALCIILQIIIMCTLSNVSSKEAYDYQEKEVICVSQGQTANFDNNAIYRLYECGGKVGVFDAQSDIIIDVLDIFVYSLPKSDREALKNGIDIYSFSELSKIIDDFST